MCVTPNRRDPFSKRDCLDSRHSLGEAGNLEAHAGCWELPPTAHKRKCRSTNQRSSHPSQQSSKHTRWACANKSPTQRNDASVLLCMQCRPPWEVVHAGGLRVAGSMREILAAFVGRFDNHHWRLAFEHQGQQERSPYPRSKCCTHSVHAAVQACHTVLQASKARPRPGHQFSWRPHKLQVRTGK